MRKFLALILLTPMFSQAQFGVLDNDFDADGMASFEVGTQTYNYGYDVAVQQDGKILVLGETELQQPVGVTSFIFRLFPDGTIDQSFGQNGVSLLQDIYARKMAIQADGKIVAVGSGMFNNSHAISFARLNGDNGYYDNSFGVGGSYFIPHPFGSELYDVAIQDDGKIVAAGRTTESDTDVLIVRLTEDGIEDNSFSFDGKVVTDVNDVDEARSLIIGDDGKITIAGIAEEEIGNFINRYSVLIRYNSDGSLDPNFGTNGILVPDFIDAAALNDIVFGESDKMYACGLIVGATDEDVLIAKFNSDGSFDNAFGVGGFTRTDVGGDDDEGVELVYQPDGRILIAAKAIQTGQSVGAMVRHNDNGLYDPSFGNIGIVTTSVGVGNSFESMVLQDDLKILCIGTEMDINFDTKASIARYTSGMNVGIGKLEASTGSTLVYPNPITDNTATVEFELGHTQDVSIQLFDLSGKLITTLQTETKMMAGKHAQSFRLPKIATGQYLLRLITEKGDVGVKISVSQ